MDGAYAAALPLALGAAVSPGLLAFELLILSSASRPRSRAWCYLLGVLTVILAFTVVGLAAVQAVIDAVEARPTAWVVALKLILASAFVAIGVTYCREPSTQPGGLQDRWEGRLRRARLPAFYAFGVLTMMTNWSTLILYLTAMDLVRGADDTATVRLLVSLLVLLVTIAPLLLPVLSVTLVGHRSDPLLARMGEFTTAHNRQINAGIYFLVALLFVGSAVTGVM